MIKHIVFWRLKEEAESASKVENARKIKEMLEALGPAIPEIKQIEVGINVLDSPAACDVALYSEFASPEALDVYQKHPEHENCKGFIGKVTSDRFVVDYEI